MINLLFIMPHENLGFTSSTDAVDSKDRLSQTDNRNSYTPRDNITSNVYVLELEDKKKYVKEFEGDYEPHEHRNIEHPTTHLETLFHFLKVSLGTGILAMPKAFYNAGYAVGVVGTLVIGLLCTYCMHILIRSGHELCRRKKVPSLTYPAILATSLDEGPDIFRRFSKSSVHVMNITLCVYQLGTCCVYVVFIATNLKSALDTYVVPIDVRLYMLMLLLPLIFINWVRNLKYLVPFSTVANIITFASFGIIIYYLFRETPNFTNQAPIGEVQNFPLFFGTVLFALEAVGVILPLENEMKNPKSFNSCYGVLNVGMGTIIILYIGMGFFGYMRYGDDIKGSITLNLPNDEILAKVVQLLLALSMYVTHALQCYVAIDIIWNEYLIGKIEKDSHKTFWEYVVRTLTVVLTLMVAVAIPELELFIALYGALCLSTLGLGFPAIVQTCTFWSTTDRNGKIIMIAKNTSLIAFSILGLVVGTYTSLRDIVKTFS